MLNERGNMSSMKEHPIYTDYCITKDGRVWSKLSNKFLKPHKISDGHLQLNLRSTNRHKSIHRLVLETFVGPCPSGMECRHLDGNPENNNINNLRWGTRSENAKDSYRHGTLSGFNGTRGESHHNVKLTKEEVKLIYSYYWSKLYNKQELSQMFNISKPNISCIVYKQTWKHIWE